LSSTTSLQSLAFYEPPASAPGLEKNLGFLKKVF